MGTEKLSGTQYKTPLHVADPEIFVIVLIGSTRILVISGKKSMKTDIIFMICIIIIMCFIVM